MSYYSSGGPSMRIDLDRNYYKDEVVVFDYVVVQDYMYQMNKLTDGETVYDFTPAWFTGAKVDELIIKWGGDQVLSQSPSCLIDGDGYYTWTASLPKGESYSVSITYPNDAFAFDDTKVIGGGSSYNGDYDDDVSISDIIFGAIGMIFVLPIMTLPIWLPIVIIRSIVKYTRSANFTASEPKITRTKVVYYPNCPGCGAPRPDGANNCPYCGRSFIKSEEKIEEKDIPKEEKALKSKVTDGLYAYSTQPNTYIRIHVTPAPRSSSSSRPKSRGGSSFWSSGGSSGSSHSSSSHHSSCAHSSCACACACACAGSGRAGCSTKDFYNTDLKLRQLEMKDSKEKESEKAENAGSAEE